MLRRWKGLGVVMLLLLALAGEVRPALAQDPFCGHPANLTVNCGMDTFTDRSSGGNVRIVADGWEVWVEAGAPAFDPSPDSPVPPSQRIWSDGAPFTAGMFQQLRVEPGRRYLAGVVWAPYTAPDGSIMRQVGLDPAGGTNPNAASVRWSAPDWAFSRLTYLETAAVASGERMTLFVRVHNPQSHGADQIFIDGVWAHVDDSAPPAATATATLVPPSPTPSVAASASPTASPTASATASATATLRASATVGATWTPVPTRTLTPSATAAPSATATERPSATASPTPEPTTTATPSPLATLTVPVTATATRTAAPTASTTLTAEPTATVTVVLASQAPPALTPVVAGSSAIGLRTAGLVWLIVGALSLFLVGVGALWQRLR